MIDASVEFSIITVCLNSVNTIEQTINSVLIQNYPNIKYYIIDGGSSDGTLEVIERYSDSIYYWESNTDHGIYSAMNRGIDLVKNLNSYIFFLNADDFLYNQDVLYNLASDLGEFDFVYGKVALTDGLNKYIVGKELNKTQLPFSMIQHQSTFVKKMLFCDLGKFSEDFLIVSDYEFAIKVFLSNNKYKIKFIDIVISYMRLGGISGSRAEITFKEKCFLIKKYYSSIVYFQALVRIQFYELLKFRVVKYYKSNFGI